MAPADVSLRIHQECAMLDHLLSALGFPRWGGG